jgi:hypothetical protein
MGRAGRARVLGSFTWQQVAMRTAALYDDFLSECTASSSVCRSSLTRGGAAKVRQLQSQAQTQGVSA